MLVWLLVLVAVRSGCSFKKSVSEVYLTVVFLGRMGVGWDGTVYVLSVQLFNILLNSSFFVSRVPCLL